MKITFAQTEEQFKRCWPAIRELRPHLENEDNFLRSVQLVINDGGRVLMLSADGVVPAVAVFRIGYYLHRGKNLYIDDLVCLPEYRRKGYSRALLDYIKDYALEMGCDNIHLDSGYQRQAAHRLYLNAGFQLQSHHFVLDLTS